MASGDRRREGAGSADEPKRGASEPAEAGSDPSARSFDAVAEIQARLDSFDEDLAQALDARGKGLSSGRTEELFAQLDDIERMLEELMEHEAPAARAAGPAPSGRSIMPAGPDWTPDLEALYREEEEMAEHLAESERARSRQRSGARKHGH